MEVDPRQGDGLMINQDHEGLQAVVPKAEEKHFPPEPSYSSSEKQQQPEGKRRILGLTVPIFWVVILVIVTILAGGIGGGVGGGLAAQKKDKSTSNPETSSIVMLDPTPTQTPPSPSGTSPTSSGPTSGASPGILSPCINPDTNQTTYASDGQTITSHDNTGAKVLAAFTLHCNTHYPAGADYGNPTVADLMILWTPDLQKCADACANYNLGYEVRNNNAGKCVTASITNSIPFSSSCILKSGAGPTNNTFGTPANGYRIDSAVLISS